MGLPHVVLRERTCSQQSEAKRLDELFQGKQDHPCASRPVAMPSLDHDLGFAKDAARVCPLAAEVPMSGGMQT